MQLAALDSMRAAADADGVGGTVWQAGTDPDALTIGVGVMTPKTILMNLVHIVHSDRRDESRLAPGVTLKTCPVTR